MIEKTRIYKLLQSVKGWPVDTAHNFEEAVTKIFGSPYWDIPEDCYQVIETNDIYCLLGVYEDGKLRSDYHYLTVTARLDGLMEFVDGGAGQNE